MGAAAVAAGVDTWSPAWYVDPEGDAARVMDARALVKTGRGWLLPDPVGGHRVGWNPGVGMIYAEGHPMEGALCSPDNLPAALGRLTDALREEGLPVPVGRSKEGSPGLRTSNREGFAGVRRLDAAVDLRFDQPAEGLAVLAGVASVLRFAPRTKLETIHAPDGKALETVYLRSQSGTTGRWYDKGVESNGAPRGAWLRPEDQRRYVKATRRDVGELHTAFVRDKFRKRFAVLWKASKGVKVAGMFALAERIREAIDAGEVTPEQGHKLGGLLLVGGHGLERTTRWRWERDCRELGLVLADGVMEEVEIFLQDVLEEVMETPAWGAQG